MAISIPATNKIVLFCVVLFVCACSCSRHLRQKMIPMLSEEGKKLLLVLQDETRPIRVRAEAAAELGKRQEVGCVKELVRILPGRYDLLALEIVEALKNIGDPSALPALRQVIADAENQGILIPGKIGAALENAIKTLEK